MGKHAPEVAVIMGSVSDAEIVSHCTKQLKTLGVSFELKVLSAHRTPKELDQYVAEADAKGIKVFIAAAGMSAALAGAIASRTIKPVIGIAIPSGPLAGIDALISTVQMPPGVPVGCTGIGKAGAKNAAILAAEILGISDTRIEKRLEDHRTEQTQAVLEEGKAIQQSYPPDE